MPNRHTGNVAGCSAGNDDPMIDGISFSADTSSVPEPSTWLTCLIGLALCAVAYRKSVSARA